MSGMENESIIFHQISVMPKAEFILTDFRWNTFLASMTLLHLTISENEWILSKHTISVWVHIFISQLTLEPRKCRLLEVYLILLNLCRKEWQERSKYAMTPETKIYPPPIMKIYSGYRWLHFFIIRGYKTWSMHSWNHRPYAIGSKTIKIYKRILNCG